MAETVYGYTGKLLRVDLTRQAYHIENIPRKTMADYIGGRGFVIKYLYDEVRPGTDPLGPDNKVVFATGPLTGTRMPSSGRYVVGTRSPLSGAYIRAVSGGAWGAFLKFAGYDALIIEGVAPQWCYLYIDAGGVQFRDASSLLGKLTEETETAVCEDLGNRKVRSCVIGPAGEKLIRQACIQTERRSAGRGGVGCVLGSKRVKAVAVYGTKKPTLFEPQAFKTAMRDHVKTNTGCDYYHHFHHLGTTGGVGLTYTLGVHPVKNFNQGIFDGIENLLPDAINKLNYKTGNTGCWNCYMKCGSLFDVPKGPFKGEGYENPEYETMWCFGANCLNSDFSAILAANKICDDYGVDTISTGNAVAFLMECYEKGYISEADLDGVSLKWGDPEAMLAVTKQIVTRGSRAAGWVADGGVRHAAQMIGRDAADFAIHAKGLELAAYDPRGIQAHGLGYAVSTIGGSHQIGYGVQELFGFPEPVDRFSAKDKGRHTVWANRYITIFDCAVACGFANAFTDSKLDIDSFAKWLQMATGMNDAFGSPDLLTRVFDRIYTLERAFNLRLGIGAEQDTLPKRLRTTGISDGPSAGHVWHRDELVEDYYRVRKWDLKTGVPLRATLEALDLVKVADDLAREGILIESVADGTA